MSITIPGGGTATKYNTPIITEEISFKYTDTVDGVELCTIPANSKLLAVYFRLITAFDGTGTNRVNIGDGVDDDKYVDSLNIMSGSDIRAPVYPDSHTTFKNNGALLTSETTLYALFEDGNSDAANGEAKICINYVTFG